MTDMTEHSGMNVLPPEGVSAERLDDGTLRLHTKGGPLDFQRKHLELLRYAVAWFEHEDAFIQKFTDDATYEAEQYDILAADCARLKEAYDDAERKRVKASIALAATSERLKFLLEGHDITPKTLVPGITSTPGVCSGSPCIAGTRIETRIIRELGYDIDKLTEAYPHLTITQIEVAMAFEKRRDA